MCSRCTIQWVCTCSSKWPWYIAELGSANVLPGHVLVSSLDYLLAVDDATSAGRPQDLQQEGTSSFQFPDSSPVDAGDKGLSAGDITYCVCSCLPNLQAVFRCVMLSALPHEYHMPLQFDRISNSEGCMKLHLHPLLAYACIAHLSFSMILHQPSYSLELAAQPAHAAARVASGSSSTLF